MVEFYCIHCGEREERNVLPGKHTVLGSLTTVNRQAECCNKPDYRDTTGFKQNMIDRNLKDLIALRA